MKMRPILYLAFAEIIIWAATFYLFPAMLLEWELALDWSKTELTGALTLAILLTALFSPLAGRLVDYGFGTIMLSGATLISGIALVFLSQAQALWQFYLIWAVLGIMMAGCLYEPCFALLNRARGKDAKQGIIMLTLIAGFAGSIAFPTAHGLADMFGWRTAVLCFAIVVICVATPLMLMGSNSIRHEDQTPNISTKTPVDRSFLHLKSFWLLGFAFMCLAVLHGGILSHLLPMLYECGIETQVAVIAASFIGPMQIMGRMGMMITEKHITNHGITITCFITMGLSVVVLLGSMENNGLLVAFVILFGGGYGVVSIIRPLVARDILGSTDFGGKTGSLALLYMLGVGAAPYLGSLIWTIGGYELMLQVLIIIAMVGLGFYMLARRVNTI